MTDKFITVPRSNFEVGDDEYNVFKHLEKNVFSLIPGDYVVAGGAIRALLAEEEVKDYDLYFKDKTELLTALQKFENIGAVMNKETPQAYNVSFKGKEYDFCKKYSYSRNDIPNKILKTFDFTICAFAMSKDHFYFHEKARQDLDERGLYFLCSFKTSPMRTLVRLKKFMELGYTPVIEDMAELVDAILIDYKRYNTRFNVEDVSSS